MNLIKTELTGLFEIEPKIFGDSRGYFFESYNQNKFYELGLTYNFVQDNQSYSTLGTLRGLHLQKGNSAQAKLVRVIKGRVLDVAVDLRFNSATFGQHYKCILTEEKNNMLMIPKGFAHGFIVLSDSAIFSYKCDNFYDPKSEIGIMYNDKKLGIDWGLPVDKIILSEKDAQNYTLSEIDWSQV